MKASVIIPNLNGAGWLRDSIESIWAQTEQDFELIVIDNGSTDESLEIAHSYCGNPRYHLIENSENTGFSHAVNQGIAMAKGEYMALFNNDAFAEPNWLEELLKTAESDPKIFAVSSLMLRYYEPELADDAGDYVTILGFACKRGDGLKASRYPNQIEFPDYTGAELLAITQSIAKSKGYRLDDACAMPLVAFFDRRQSENAAENGNGRMARNTLEKAILNQSKRLVADADAALDLLLPGDFELE